MKNKLKLFTLLFVLIISAVTLCGCAQVNFVTYNNPDGSIDEYIQLSINPQTLSEYGFNSEQVMLDIKTNSYTEANLLLDFYRNKLSVELALGNISNTEYTELYGGVSILEKDWNNNKYTIGFTYSNSTVYKKYYELVNNITFSTSKPEQVKKLFYTKTYYRGTTNYGDYSIFYRIYNYYSNSQFANILPQNTSLTYSYSVDTKRMHSDADHISLDDNGNYIHTWNVSPENPNKVITFYTITANRGAWIALCLGIGLIVCTILCIIAIFKHRKNSSKTPHENTNNTNPTETDNTNKSEFDN